MPHLKVITHEFEIVSDGVDSELMLDDATREETIIDCTPDAFDLADGLNAAHLAARYLRNEVPVYIEPDRMPGTPSWYSGRDDAMSGTECYIGLEGFTESERDLIERLRNDHKCG